VERLLQKFLDQEITTHSCSCWINFLEK